MSEVGVLTDHRLVAGIDLIRGEYQGRAAVYWSSGEIFTGPSSGLDLGGKLETHFKNYLQITGVRPGRNLLTLQVVKVLGHGFVRDAELLPGTQIAVSPIGPPSLRVAATLTSPRTRVGSAVVLRYRVESRGWPARRTGLIVSTSSPALSIDGRPSELLGWVSKVQGTVVLEALSPGRYNITVRASGETGGIGSTTIGLTVARRL